MDRYQNNNFYEAFKKILFIAWPGIVLTLVAVVAFWSTLILHQRTFFLFPDNVDQFYAWYQKLSVSLHNGVLPIWDANVFSGHSFVGELQSGVFYPINLIWVTLFGSVHGISVRALDWLVAIHFLIASLGMKLFAVCSVLVRRSNRRARHAKKKGSMCPDKMDNPNTIPHTTKYVFLCLTSH